MRLKTNEVLFTWPLAAHTITAGWYYSDGSLHRAIDLRAAVGTPVCAAEDGTVDRVQAWDGRSTSGDQSYGNLVRIRHADYNGGKLQTLYAHLQRVTVKNGRPSGRERSSATAAIPVTPPARTCTLRCG